MAARFSAEARSGSGSGSVTSRSVGFCRCQVYLWTQQPAGGQRAVQGAAAAAARPGKSFRSREAASAGRRGIVKVETAARTNRERWLMKEEAEPHGERGGRGRKLTHAVRVWLWC